VLPLLYIQYYGRVVRILFVVALYWLISNITDEAAARIEVRLPAERQASTHSLLALGRRVWKVLVALVLLLIVLKSFGFDVNSALAGIGIGGIALGLGAQKTLENLFGGVSVLSDGTIRVGDFCKVGDQIGTVEDIGLRATRIRTNARTVVSIPNGAVATINLENYAGRDKILMNPVISLRYETSADQLRYVIARIRETLYRHPRVESGTLRVRFISLGKSSLDVEIFAYILTPVYPEFLSIQEDLLLRIMDIVEESGTGFAFPSQTTYLGRDPGLDPEKTQAALAAVERWRQEKHIPFPDHDAETIARLRRTLDFPDPDSAIKKP
jgi:MscS family membrane protein